MSEAVPLSGIVDMDEQMATFERDLEGSKGEARAGFGAGSGGARRHNRSGLAAVKRKDNPKGRINI